jgi:hypothetical protein
VTRRAKEKAVQAMLLIVIAVLTTGLSGCAARELRCDGALEPINAASALSRAHNAEEDEHAR